MKKNKLYLSLLAMAVAVPVLAAPVPVEHVSAAQATKSTGAVVLASNPFKDISVSNPYYHIIHEMRDAGIINGYEDGTFRPNTTLSREHAAALISRALKINNVSLEVENFVEFVEPKDLSPNSPYYDDIKLLMITGLLEADANGNINPKVELTRGEMSKILAIAFNLKVKADYVFDDVKGSKYEDYVKALYSNGVTTGYEDFTFKLDGSLTRAHYVLFMHRAMNLDEDFVAEPIPSTEKEPTLPVEEDKSTSPSDSISKYPAIKYSDWSKEDILKKIPRPAGYVAGEHEAKNAAIMKEIMAENGHGFTGGISIGKYIYEVANQDYDSILESQGRMLDISVEEFVELVNYVVETGEVYNGRTFSMYYDYEKGTVPTSGVRWWN